jgi:uncharacterized protein
MNAPAPDQTPDGPAHRSLHPRAITLWRLRALAAGALLVAGMVAAELLLDLPAPTGLATSLAAVAVAAYTLLVPPARYRAWRMTLRPDDLVLHRGILFRTTTIVPHARIQHVDTQHGPLDRVLGLADLVVFTAGSRGAILTVPALALAEAERLRDSLAELSGTGDAV